MPASTTRQQRWLRAAILIIGTFTFLAFLFADPLLRSLRKRDQIGATPQQGVATVVTLVPPHPQVGADPTPALVAVRFRGGIHVAKTVLEYPQLKVGQSARIEYRVGKSGAIYVDTVEPLPSTPPPPRHSHAP
jgi:hypothetical protein